MTVIIPPAYIAALYFDGKCKPLDLFCAPEKKEKKRVLGSLWEKFAQKPEPDSLVSVDAYLERVGFQKQHIQIFRRSLKDVTTSFLADQVKANPGVIIEFNENFHLGFRLNDKSVREDKLAFERLRDDFLNDITKQASRIQQLLWTGKMHFESAPKKAFHLS